MLKRKFFFFFLNYTQFFPKASQAQETNLCHCGPNVKFAVAGNRNQVAVLTAVSPLPPELDAPVDVNETSYKLIVIFFIRNNSKQKQLPTNAT